jgi:NhaP-type Na+/H+ or K+/H+ antiporter
MENFELWCVIAGAILLLMALLSTLIERLPLTSAVIYLGVGALLGPLCWNLLHFDPIESAKTLERAAEVAVLISLFTAGLKLRVSLDWRHWHMPIRLATVSMVLTVALITAVGTWLLKLPLGAAILLGAILAPTDPVLASDVQVQHSRDRDRLRFGLTGEAGLNDGTAFPFVMLGLGLLGLHDIGDGGWRWFTIDVLWATIGGLAIGALLGTLVGRFVLFLRREHKEAVGLDDFLALGLVALTYGCALEAKTYGFLAVFAAGLALRRVERTDALRSAEAQSEKKSEAKPEADQKTETERKDAGASVDEGGVDGEVNEQVDDGALSQPNDDESRPSAGERGLDPRADKRRREELATDPVYAPSAMMRAVLLFNEHLERIGEVVIVILIGSMLTAAYFVPEAWWFVPLLFLVVRPLAVWIGTLGAGASTAERAYTAWFGIRGIGSMYYLTYAIGHGLPKEVASQISALVLTTIAVSVVVHGMSVTPFMNRYQERRKSKR